MEAMMFEVGGKLLTSGEALGLLRCVLDQRRRLVLASVYFDRLSVREIAAGLGVSSVRVQQIKQDGVARLAAEGFPIDRLCLRSAA